MSNQPGYTYPNQPQPPHYTGQYQQNAYVGQHQQGAYASYSQMYGQQLPEHMDKPVAPKALKIAAILVYCIAGLNVVAQVFQMICYDELQGLQQETWDKVLGTSEFNSFGVHASGSSNKIVTFALIMVLVFSLIWNAATAVCALFMAKGQNWARIVLTVYISIVALGILNVASWFLAFHWTRVFELICGLLAVAALIFFWQRPVNDYMRQARIYKQWTQQQAYLGHRP